MSAEEPHVISALIGLCKQHNIKTLVQVGAEDGYEADEIRKATECRTVCIDADYKCVPVNNAIEWHYQMIGATDGPADFYTNVSIGLSSPYQRGNDHGEEKKEQQQMRLDTFCAEHGITPDALIIDTEGSTLDVLEGCGDLLNGVKMIYAEIQAYAIRPGIRPVSDVDALLLPLGFTHHRGLPSYDGGAQSNLTWVKP